MKKRILAALLAAALLLGLASAAGADAYVTPATIDGFATTFNALASQLGAGYGGLRFTSVNLNRSKETFTLRGPENLSYAYGNTMKLTVGGSYDTASGGQQLTSVTITAAPLDEAYASGVAYREEWTRAAMLALQSIVSGATANQAADALDLLGLPANRVAMGKAYYQSPVALMSKGVSASATINNFPVDIAAEIEQSGKLTLTAKLGGIYPYPTQSNDYWWGSPYATYYTPPAAQPAVSSEQVINVVVGERFSIQLAYAENSGYTWTYAASGTASIRQESAQFLAPSASGGLATQQWNFIATSSGTHTFTFSYSRPGDAVPAGTAVYTVYVA